MVRQTEKKKGFIQNSFSRMVFNKASKLATTIYILSVHHEGIWENGGMTPL